MAIRGLDTDATVRGGSAKSRKCTVAKYLYVARARGTRDVLLTVSIDVSFESFYCEASFTNFFYETRRREKKKKYS